MEVIIFICGEGEAPRAFRIPEDWATGDVDRFIQDRTDEWLIAAVIPLETATIPENR